MCPLRGDRTRGLAPFVGIGEVRFRAEPMTGCSVQSGSPAPYFSNTYPANVPPSITVEGNRRENGGQLRLANQGTRVEPGSSSKAVPVFEICNRPDCGEKTLFSFTLLVGAAWRAAPLSDAS